VAQHRDDEARLVRARFERAWTRADVTLTASRILGEAGHAGHTQALAR
jgi:hypothetical protein